jgi:FHS family L-fucose permease-like MFS transporter
MHIDTPAAAAPHSVPANAASLQTFVFALFFIFGGITSLNDVIIPKLKDLFTLSYAQAMLVQSAFFAAYFIVSIPAAAIVRRIGYMRTAVVGLLTMTAGCLLFIPASSSGVFATFLVALFVLASGITIVQVVANPLISLLGAPQTAHSRLTFAQAFNSLGTTVFPYVGAILILGSLATGRSGDALGRRARRLPRAGNAGRGEHLYRPGDRFGGGGGLVWHNRNKLVEHAGAEGQHAARLRLLQQPRFAFGALCIFLYVGAEVAVGSLIVNYLMEANVLGLSAEEAGKHVPLYWGGAMVGRFIGAALLRMFSPGKVLACAAGMTIALLLVSANTSAAGLGLGAAGGGPVQFDHVPDHFLAGLRRVWASARRKARA